MTRATGNVASHRRRKRTLKRAKGYFGARSKQIRSAKMAVIRAGKFAFRDRRTRRRSLRKLWILRISAAVRARGMTYSAFINGLNRAQITMNRKSLSALATEEPGVFDRLVSQAMEART